MKKFGVGFVQPSLYLIPQGCQIFGDLGEFGRRDSAGQIVARGVALLRMRFDLAHPFLARGGILRCQCVFEALGYALVMALAERHAKTAGAESNVGKRQDAILGGLETQIVGDTFHSGVRLRAVHDAEEIGNLFWAAGLSLVPTELYQLF